MKYKNIELVSGYDSEAELLCSVEFKNPEEDEDIVYDMGYKLEDIFENFTYEVDVESVTDTIITVRCDDITFDKKGIKLLKKIYDKLIKANLDAKVTVNTHIDGDVWFKDENNHEYNEDEVESFDEFLSYIEY